MLFILFYFIRIRCLWWDGCFQLWLCYIGMNVLVHSIKVVGQLEVFVWFAGLFDQREKEKHGTVLWKKLNKFNQKEQNSTYDLAVFFLLGRECCPKWPVWLLDGWWFFPSRTQAAPNLVRGGGGFAGRDGNSPRHCIHCLAVLHPNQHHRLARCKFIVLFCLQFCLFSLTTICNFTMYFWQRLTKTVPAINTPQKEINLGYTGSHYMVLCRRTMDSKEVPCTIGTSGKCILSPPHV